MRSKGHELKLENGLALKSASNSFATALCGINSPEKKITSSIHNRKVGSGSGQCNEQFNE